MQGAMTDAATMFIISVVLTAVAIVVGAALSAPIIVIGVGAIAAAALIAGIVSLVRE